MVSIGIPAYNRPVELERAVRSALAQSHVQIEVVVSDDASPDPRVAEIARSLAANDDRVRVSRQPRNLGHAGNYQWVLDAARGEYFMWLADDDWLDPEYVHRCLTVLRADAAVRLVCGLARYYRRGQEVAMERPTDLVSARSGLRVLRFFTGVTMNGGLFGVARRRDLLDIGFAPEVGGDWLLVGALAGRGAIRTLTDVHIHRSAAGLGDDRVGLARSFGLRGLRARQHHLFVAGRVWRAIAAGPPLFPAISVVGRMTVATGAAASIIARFTVADGVRTLLGPDLSRALERSISTWLRSRDGA